ncbi:hypothetical protein ACLMJK_000769 [Lecanora helva]
MSIFRSVFFLVAATSGYLAHAQPTLSSNSTTPTCTQPTGLANTYVPVPASASLGVNFQIKPSFDQAHRLFDINDLSASFSEAAVATLCFETCVAYQNDTKGPCLSFNVNYGVNVPPTGKGGPPYFYCTGYDYPVASDGSDYVSRPDAPESFLYPISVNRRSEGGVPAVGGSALTWDAHQCDLIYNTEFPCGGTKP